MTPDNNTTTISCQTRRERQQKQQKRRSGKENSLTILPSMPKVIIFLLSITVVIIHDYGDANLLSLFPKVVVVSAQDTQQLPSEPEQESQTYKQRTSYIPPKKHIFQGCRLYLAKKEVGVVVNNNSHNSNFHQEWGVFTGAPLKRGQVIAPPDIALHLYDYSTGKSSKENDNDDKHVDDPLQSLLAHYASDSHISGGFYEGKKVVSILPGIGSMASTVPSNPTKNQQNTNEKLQKVNALPFRADVDEANVPRDDPKKPGAGAFTHYHNLTFHAMTDLEAGSEILVSYPQVRREHSLDKEDYTQSNSSATSVATTTKHDVKWLQEHAYCIDNLKADRSTTKGAGRGAFAVRFIPKDTLISLSPVIAIANRTALNVPVRSASNYKKVESGGRKKAQLLLNYCLRPPTMSGVIETIGNNPDAVFLPIAPVVNLINHGMTSNEVNTRIQWKEVAPSSFQLEYIATRDIKPKEEIFLDYGREWENSWKSHAKEWETTTTPFDPANFSSRPYTPGYVMDDVAGLLRTEKEQLDHSYADNLMTFCFYKYNNVDSNSGTTSTAMKNTETTSVRWKLERGTFDFRNLRPCSIVQREEVMGGNPDGIASENKFMYTVMVKNRNGLDAETRIPKGEMPHLVTHVPRQAIRFWDRMYSADAHLPNAFREVIGTVDHKSMIRDNLVSEGKKKDEL